MANYGTYGAITTNKKPQEGILYTNLQSTLYLSEYDMMKTVRIGIANAYTICLPDATQLNNKRQIIIVNTQGSIISINNANGTLLTKIYPYETVMFWCSDISTVVGTWAISVLQKQYRNNIVSAGNITSYSSANDTAISTTMCTLSSTSVLVAYRAYDSAAMVTATRAKILTLSSDFTSITVNSYVTVYNSASTSFPRVLALSSTSVFICYIGANNYLYGNILTVSGTTISVGSLYTIYNTSADVYCPSVAMLSSTSVIVLFSASNAPKANVLTITGSTISGGTSTSITTGYNTLRTAICALNSTTAIAVYAGTGGSNWYALAQLLTISGSTITANSVTIVYSNSGTQIAKLVDICAISNSAAVFIYSGVSDYLYANILTISGTSIVAGNTATVYNTAAVGPVNYGAVRLLKPNTAIAFYYGASAYGYLSVLSLSGTDVLTQSTTLTFSTGTDSDTVTVIDNSTALSAVTSTNSYGFAQFIFIN